MVLSSNISLSQCMSDKLQKDCSSMLDSYIFVKSFNVNEATEVSYVFSKGTQYVITLCDEASSDNEKMVVELYDRQHKLVASSYIKKTNKHYAKIGYPCNATGVYYMKYSFQDGSAGCGVSVLGFKRH